MDFVEIKMEQKPLFSISDIFVVEGVYRNSELIYIRISVKIRKNQYAVFSFRPDEFEDFIRFIFYRLYDEWEERKEKKRNSSYEFAEEGEV